MKHLARSRVARLVLATSALGCARAAPTPAAAPAPAPVAPILAPTSNAIAVTQRAGRSLYEYSASASVSLEGDAATAAERVTTTASLRLVVSGADPQLTATVTVDSFAVFGGGRVASAERLRTPTRVDASIDARDGRITVDDRLPADCASPSTAARLTARAVLLSLPPSLISGATWSDSSTTESCRGGLLMHSQTERRYLVEATDAKADGVGGAPLLRITRRSTGTLTGAPSVGTQGPTVTGTIEGTAKLFVNPQSGRVVMLDGESTTQLTLAMGTRTQRMTQRATESVRMR